MTAEYYKSWRNDTFGVADISVDKPAYLVREERDVATPPKMIPLKKPACVQPRKSASVNTTRYEVRIIEKEGFKVVVDANGNVLTDMALLQKLRVVRTELAKEKNLPAYCILSNNTLAMLATDKPTTREEFMAIQGVGTRRYEQCGDAFIVAIKQYNCK